MKNIRIGDNIQFSLDGVKSISGEFAGFRNSDTGITLPPTIRKFLGIQPKQEVNFSVTIRNKIFVVV